MFVVVAHPTPGAQGQGWARLSPAWRDFNEFYLLFPFKMPIIYLFIYSFLQFITRVDILFMPEDKSVELAPS